MHDPFGLPWLLPAPADLKRRLKAIRSAERLNAASLRALAPASLNATKLRQASRVGTARRVGLADNRQAPQQLFYPVSTPAQGKHDAILLPLDAQALGVARPCVDRGGVRAGAEEGHRETRLMKCHLLGRRFEEASPSHVAPTAPALGAKRLAGEYIPSRRTATVCEHLRSLGFTHVAERKDGGSVWSSTRCAMSRPNCR